MLPIAAAPVEGKRRVSDRGLRKRPADRTFLVAAGGPGSVGAARWGDICVVAPRTAWLRIVRDEFEAAGLKTALQMRRNRNGDNPVYAWLSGLLAVVCDPENTFEWVGVLREVFAVSDSTIASALGDKGRLNWEDPGQCPGPVGAAIDVIRPYIDRAEAEGEYLGRFASELAAASGLAGIARLSDPEGGLGDELARLLARADDLGIGGARGRAPGCATSWVQSTRSAPPGARRGTPST
jgi:hypothetical protein